MSSKELLDVPDSASSVAGPRCAQPPDRLLRHASILIAAMVMHHVASDLFSVGKPKQDAKADAEEPKPRSKPTFTGVAPSARALACPDEFPGRRLDV